MNNNIMILSVQIINKAKDYVNHSNERELDLRSKNISEIANLNATMNYFQSLDLSNNHIKVLKNFHYLDGIKSLMLANNRISVIDNVGEFMPNLQNLFLMNNRIQDIKEVKKLVNCPQLTNLVLRNNPVCDSLNYKEMVISSLLSIKILDFRKISPQQREEAIKLYQF